MFGPDLRSRLTRLSFALSLASLSSFAFGCGSEEPSTGERRSSADSDDDDDNDDDDSDDDDDDEKPSKTVDAGKGSGKDAGAAKGSDAGKASTGGATKDAGKAGTGSSSSSDSDWCKAFAVIEDRCNSCHGAETAAGAPMSLATYDDFMADAPVTDGKKVHEVVKTRIHDTKKPMPPTDPLTSDELAKIDAWLEGGMEAGDDPSCAGGSKSGGSTGEDKPSTPWPPEGCEVYKLTAGNGQKVSVPAGQETHPQFTINPPWGNKEVHAIAFKPITDNTKVLHHWILYANGLTFVTGWAPGQDDADKKPLPPDVGIFIPSAAGSLRLDMHYNNLQGKAAELDESGVEVCVAEPRKYAATTYMGFMQIPVIPAGQEVDIVGDCAVSVTQPVFLLTESPHAHKLATHMKFEVIRASGERVVLRDAPFAFDAQISKALPEPFELKTGDRVITTCHFKNDTNALVTFGENTGNEMCFNFASYYPMGALSCGGGLGGLLGGGGGTGATGGGTGGLGGFGF